MTRLAGTCCALMLVVSGCTESGSESAAVESVWGRRGLSEGRFQKPRAMAIDGRDQLYIVDMTGRIQVFSGEGHYLRGWRTPRIENGKPSGLTINREGNLLVADTHYHRMLCYSPEGKLLEKRTIGGTLGHGPGQFEFVTDAVQDSQGNYYIAEYGAFDRVQKFSIEGDYLFQWGGHGDEPGQFIRPQNLAIDDRDHVWVVDACNHRVQVFDATGDEAKLVQVWGEHGNAPGRLDYPYDLVLDGQGHVYICEFGNHRIQKFTIDGRPLAVWGSSGRRPGQLNRPWALVQASDGRLHILDTENHRVQTIRL